MVDREAGREAAGIGVLGSLFRATEVFLREDEVVIRSDAESSERSLSSEPATNFSSSNSCVTADEETSTSHTVTGRLHLHGTMEDPKLVYEMDVMGLPLSFGTSKVSKNIHSRSKRRSAKPKSVSHGMDINKPVPEVTVFNEVENADSSKFLHDSPNVSSSLCTTKGQTDTSYPEAKEQRKGDWHSEESASIAAMVSRNINDEKPDLVDSCDLNIRNIIKSEVSPDTICFESNAEVLGSLSLCGDNCPEEVFEKACFQPEFQQAVDLSNEDVEKCSVDSCTSFCSKHSKGDEADSETMQSCSTSAESLVFHPLDDQHGNWRVIWDSFYKCNYFFNDESHESTWYPPPGLEKYAFSCSNLSFEESDPDEKDAGSEHAYGSESLMKNEDEVNDCKDLDKKKEKQHGIPVSYYWLQSTINEDGDESPESNTGSSIDVLESYENVSTNKKRRIRRRQSNKGHNLIRISNISVKYWLQRYSLFTRFDDGIKMDDEGFYSVTPELIAKHHALRCGGGSIIDCFTGVGGNAIQFAMRASHVIAIDVDPVKIDYAKHNADIYGVRERIDFIKADFFKIAPKLKGDVAFLSPPWGGPDYAKVRTYDIGSLRPHHGHYLFKIASKIAAKIVMFLPRNVNLQQLVDLSLSTNPPWKLEVEKNYLNGKLKSITAYFDRAGE